MYETYNDKLQPYFLEKNLHLPYMDTDSFIVSVNTNDIIRDLKFLDDIFDFSNLDRNHELFSTNNEKVIREFKIETLKKIWIDEFFCLRSKTYSFKCGEGSKHKLNGISKSQSKLNVFEEYYNCLIGGEYQKECDIYINRSLNLEMYLQKVRKSTLSLFDGKRCDIIEVESKPWK